MLKTVLVLYTEVQKNNSYLIKQLHMSLYLSEDEIFSRLACLPPRVSGEFENAYH